MPVSITARCIFASNFLKGRESAGNHQSHQIVLYSTFHYEKACLVLCRMLQDENVGRLQDFEADHRNIVNFGRVNVLALCTLVELIHHFNNGQIFDLTKFLVKIEAG